MNLRRAITTHPNRPAAPTGKRTRILLVPATLLVGICTTGCTEPQAKYVVTAGESIVSVRADDFGISDEMFSRVGRHALSTEPTSGRFPAGLCVVRVEAIQGPETDRRTLRVSRLPAHHAVYWNQLFDELPSIREVVFLSKSGLDPRGSGWREVLGAAEKIDATLCILYARLEQTDADAEYAGVLWNTQNAQPIAVFRTPVWLPEDFLEAFEASEEEDADPVTLEAGFRAEQDLRRLVRDLVWDLVRQDRPSATTQPSPWKTDLPIFPRDYLRYRDPRYVPRFPKQPR